MKRKEARDRVNNMDYEQKLEMVQTWSRETELQISPLPSDSGLVETFATDAFLYFND